MKKLLMVLVTGILVLESSTLAGPLVLEQVSGGASWVVHANQEQFKKTQTGQLIRKEMVNLGIEDNLSNFAMVFSFHPLDDVRDVTIYGTAKDPEKAVALIDGFFDKERILSLLRMNPRYQEIQYGDIALHQWIDENQKDPNKLMYGCFYKDDLIVMSAGLDAVKQQVDVLKGKAKCTTGEIFNQAVLAANGAFFQAVGKRVGELIGEQEDPQAAALKQTDQLGIVVGESEGDFYIDLGLIAKSADAAQAITQILEGIIAFVSLPNQETPLLAEMAKKVKVSCELNKVQIRFESEPEAVVQFLKEQWQKNTKKDSPKQ
jgi:uncharacterized protein YjbJ (UPF0337 family)